MACGWYCTRCKLTGLQARRIREWHDRNSRHAAMQIIGLAIAIWCGLVFIACHWYFNSP